MQHPLGFPIFFTTPRTWHFHVYDKRPTRPTPHGITDILGLERSSPPVCDQPDRGYGSIERARCYSDLDGRSTGFGDRSYMSAFCYSGSPDGRSECSVGSAGDNSQRGGRGSPEGYCSPGEEERVVMSNGQNSRSTIADNESGSEGWLLRSIFYLFYFIISLFSCAWLARCQ